MYQAVQMAKETLTPYNSKHSDLRLFIHCSPDYVQLTCVLICSIHGSAMTHEANYLTSKTR